MSDTRETEDKIIHGVKATTNLILFRGSFSKGSLWFLVGFWVFVIVLLIASRGA